MVLPARLPQFCLKSPCHISLSHVFLSLFVPITVFFFPKLGVAQDNRPPSPQSHQSDCSNFDDISSEQRIVVKKIQLSSSTKFTTSDFSDAILKVQERSVSYGELQALAYYMTSQYAAQGFITSQVKLCKAFSDTGIIEFQAVEGKISEPIKITGLKTLPKAYLEARIRLGISTPWDKNALEDQIRLLKADPLFKSISAKLASGKYQGESILIVEVEEASRFSAQVGSDNFSPPSVGSERIGGTLSYRSLEIAGDEISASYYRSLQGGSNLVDLNYRVPVNPMNGTLQFRVTPSNSRIITREFQSFNIRSNSRLYEMSYRQPLIRTFRKELAFSINLTFQDGQTFLFNDIPFPFGIGPEADGNSRTRVLKLGQDYVSRGLQGAWAFSSQFNFGLNLLNATQNPDPIPDGQFFSWSGQIQRVQRLGANNLLIAQAEVQLTPDSLLPSQQFTIGGGQSLRGYRQGVRSGDNGVRLSLENRITIQRNGRGASTLQLAPFFECGSVWNHPGNPNFQAKQNFLAGLGLGLLWEPSPQLQMRLDYGLPLVKLSDRGNNLQDQALYFSLKYSP